MKKTLYLKFILAYFIFGVFGFIIVTTFVPNMTPDPGKGRKSLFRSNPDRRNLCRRIVHQ